MTVRMRKIFPKPDSEISWDKYTEKNIHILKTYISKHYEDMPMQISLLAIYLLDHV